MFIFLSLLVKSNTLLIFIIYYILFGSGSAVKLVIEVSMERLNCESTTM